MTVGAYASNTVRVASAIQRLEVMSAVGKHSVVLYYLDKLDRAEAILTNQIRKHPKRPYAYYNLGLVYAKQKKYGMAIGALQRFIQLAPKGDGDVAEARKKIRWIRRHMR